MSNPRLSVNTDGIGFEAVTVKIDNATITYDVTKPNGTAQAGLAVTLSADDTVALAGDGEHVFGKLLSVSDDNMAAVQTGGFMTLPAGTGAALTLGKAIVGDLLATAPGYVREVNTATVAELGVQNGAIVNAADTTAVIVKL